MILIIKSLCALIALLHLYFMYLEIFLWKTPFGLKTFKMSKEKAEMSEVLAKNQGLYNGFLSAGLIWAITHSIHFISLQLMIFFLGCVAVAGIYGAYTVSKRIFYIQAMPAIVGLVLIIVTYKL